MDSQMPHPRTGWRFPPERRHGLNTEERMRWLKPQELLEWLEIDPGETGLDIGAGTGYFTVPLARLLEGGTVYAIDVEPVMLEEVQSAARAAGIDTIRSIQSEELSIPLPDHIADVAVAAFVLHEPAQPLALLKEIHRLLLPGARMLVIEWQKWPTADGPPVEHRLSRREMEHLLGEAGFDFTPVDAPIEDVYVLRASLGIPTI